MTEITITNAPNEAYPAVTTFAQIADGEFFRLDPYDDFVLMRDNFRHAIIIGGDQHGGRVIFGDKQRPGDFSKDHPVTRFAIATVRVG